MQIHNLQIVISAVRSATVSEMELGLFNFPTFGTDQAARAV